MKKMNLSAESQNWSKEMRLDNRISKLENAMAPKELKHVMLAGDRANRTRGCRAVLC